MEGLRSLLESSENPSVVATETSILEATDAIRELRPSLVIVDRAFGSHAVVNAVRAWRMEPQPPMVVVWGSGMAATEAMRYVQAGAAGVIRKNSSLERLLQAI